ARARSWRSPGQLLLRRYRAFAGRRLVVLGSGAIALEIAETALEHGHAVAGIVEVEAELRGPVALRDRLAARGVPCLTGCAIREAAGRGEVEGAVIVRLDAAGQPIAGSETTIACDTIVNAIGAVPNVELLDVLGCKLEFR